RVGGVRTRLLVAGTVDRRGDDRERAVGNRREVQTRRGPGPHRLTCGERVVRDRLAATTWARNDPRATAARGLDREADRSRIRVNRAADHRALDVVSVDAVVGARAVDARDVNLGCNGVDRERRERAAALVVLAVAVAGARRLLAEVGSVVRAAARNRLQVGDGV